MTTIAVKDANGSTQNLQAPLAPGRAAASASRPVVLSDDDIAILRPGKWETVAASQDAQVLGTTGAIGDFLSHLLIVPASTSPGAVQIQDGSGSAITVFAGGTSSLTNLVAFAVPLGMTSVSGGWAVTTGASVSVVAVGEFS